MSRAMKWVLALLAVIVAALLLRSYFGAGPGTTKTGPVGLEGTRAQSFAVLDTSGRASGLDRYAGKTIVLNLWASWCPPCRAEMPDLQRLYVAQRSRNLVVLGVDQGESTQAAASFAKSLGITYPILIDDRQQYGGVYAALGLPSTFVIDPHGTIVHAFDGPLTYGQMLDALRGIR
jgi:peroxiredoxin